MSSSPPTLSRQGSGIIAFENATPAMQKQMSCSLASHSILPTHHMSEVVVSPKTLTRAVTQDRTTFTAPKKAATDRYLNSLLTRTRGYQ